MISNEEFIAEMDRRRKAAEEAAPKALEYDGLAPQSETAASRRTDMRRSSGETGIIGFLINKGIAKNKSQANMILIATIVVVLGIIVWINFF